MLYVLWVMICQEIEKTSEDYVWVLLEKGKGRGPWGLIGGECGAHWTFLFDSQPLVDLFLLLLNYEVLNPLLHMMIDLGN